MGGALDAVKLTEVLRSVRGRLPSARRRSLATTTGFVVLRPRERLRAREHFAEPDAALKSSSEPLARHRVLRPFLDV